jgi:hypothetical protein
MTYSSHSLVVTMILAFCVFSTGFTSEVADAQQKILTKSTLKVSKLKVSVTPTSGQSGSTVIVTVTGATPNGKAVRIAIGGSGHTYNADSNGKIVTKEVISGLVGDKVKIEAEDVSKGAYPP